MKKANIFTSLKTGFHLILFLILTLNSFLAIGQDEIETKAIQSIASYLHYGGSTVTDEILSQSPINYHPQKGSLLESEWPSLNAMTKIAVAYKSAEAGMPNVGGQRFLALLSQTLAQRYYIASESESPLFVYHKLTVKESLNFKAFGITDSSSKLVENIPEDIRTAIGAIAKYTDAGALGGIRQLLITHFKISENDVNEILIKKTSIKDALLETAQKYTDGKTRETLKAIAYSLFSTFESSSYDEHLLKLFDEEERLAIKSKYKPTSKNQFYKIEPKKVIDSEIDKSIKEYNDYKKTNEGEAPSFKKMKKNRRGFGGIILGNGFSSTLNEEIQFVRWIPYSVKGSAVEGKGRLEFVMSDSSTILYKEVYQEDFYAANEIIFGDSVTFQEGEGIGLTGLTYINYPDGTKRHEIIIHPAIKFLKLGWSVIITDAYLECINDIEEKLLYHGLLSEYDSVLSNWVISKPTGWKISETSLLITETDRKIEVIDSLHKDHLFFAMVGDLDDYSSELKEFKNLLPALFKISPEFNRLRDFTEVVTLMRWISNEKTEIYGTKTFKYDAFVQPPNCLVVTPDNHLSFYGLKEDKEAIRKAILSIIDSIDVIEHKEIIQEVSRTLKKQDDVWFNIEHHKSDKNIKKMMVNPKKECSKLYSYLNTPSANLESLAVDIVDSLKILNSQIPPFDRITFLDDFSTKEIVNSDIEMLSSLIEQINNIKENDTPISKRINENIISFLLFKEMSNLSKNEFLFQLYSLLNYENKLIQHYLDSY